MAPSIVPDLLDMMPDTVLMQAGTFDSRGKFTPVGTPVEIPANVHGITGEAKDGTGRTVHGAKVRATLGGIFGATERHQFTLPARFQPNVVRPLLVEQSTDENGPHHETVWF